MKLSARIAVCLSSLLITGSLNARLVGATASHKGFDAFMHRINQSPLPLIPSFRSEDRQHVEKFVQHMARFVGDEQFTLKVGKALIKRAADVGLSVDGVVSDSGLDAAKVINQPMHEVNIDQHNAFAIPLADALAFCGAINELTLLHRQAFETLEAQGVSHREAVAVLNDPEVKKQLEAIAETRHQILDAQLNAEEQFTKQETELAQKAAELAPEADAFALLESGSVSDFLAEENTPLEQKIAFEKLCGDYAQIQEERKQIQERLGYQCVSAANCAYKKAAQLAVRHPNAAQAVFAAIGWLTETLEQYARIEGAILGATLGSATGPWGTAAGIAGGMVLMEGATKAVAGAMDEGIQRVKNYATQLAKTEAEAAEFGQAVEGLAGAGVLAVSARAGRRWLGKRRAAKMASVAIEKESRLVRPTPRQSEIDVGKQLGPQARPQVSFLNGKEVRCGLPDSVRPDHIYKGVASIEVKNYDLNKNASKLIYEVSQQALKRAEHLPEGMKQYVSIDARGQIISPAQVDAIRAKITAKTNGLIKASDVYFIMDPIK